METELEKAIREVERLRSLPIMDASRCYHGDESIVVCNLKVAFEAEKRRTAACLKVIGDFVKFRRGDVVSWENAGGPNECKHGFAAGLPCIDCTMIEAQKLLAPSDSGGEKDFEGTHTA